MTRKQQIYRDMLSWALPQARNCLSWFAIDEHLSEDLSPEWRQVLKEQFQKAVPKDKRQQLLWDGPQGDYAWARPHSETV